MPMSSAPKYCAMPLTWLDVISGVCSSVLVGKIFPAGALRINSMTVLVRSAGGVLMKKSQKGSFLCVSLADQGSLNATYGSRLTNRLVFSLSGA